MEKKLTEQPRKEVGPKELEKVNGGIFIPIRPYVDDQDKEDRKDGGATGSW